MLRRKQLYVDKVIQGRIIKRITLYLVMLGLLIWHAMFLRHGLSDDRGFSESYATFFGDHLWLLVLFGILFPFFVWDMMKLTNRVAGPLARIQGALTEMTRGHRIEKVQLREHDLLFDFVHVFNEFVECRNRQIDALGDVEEQKDTAYAK